MSTIFLWLLIICIVAFFITQAILPSNGNGDIKADWIDQRNKFFEYMEWLGVDYCHAEEAYSKIKKYKDLLKANKRLNLQKNARKDRKIASR